jgi:predicted phosphodiesterase
VLQLVISDLQIPFHDRRVLNAALDIALKEQPDVVHMLGDVGDFFSVSRFVEEPRDERLLRLKFELENVGALIDNIRGSCPKAKVHFHCGNHEARLQKYVYSRVGPLAGLDELRLENLLRLKERGVEYHEYGTVVKVDGIGFTHGQVVRKNAGAAALETIMQTGCSTMMGHTHRMGYVAKRMENKVLEGWEIGCCCRLNLPYVVGTPNWQQGFAVVEDGQVTLLPWKGGIFWKGRHWGKDKNLLVGIKGARA